MESDDAIQYVKILISIIDRAIDAQGFDFLDTMDRMSVEVARQQIGGTEREDGEGY